MNCYCICINDEVAYVYAETRAKATWAAMSAWRTAMGSAFRRVWPTCGPSCRVSEKYRGYDVAANLKPGVPYKPEYMDAIEEQLKGPDNS